MIHEETNKLLKQILDQLVLLNKNITQGNAKNSRPQDNAGHGTSNIASNIERMRQEIMNKTMGSIGSMGVGVAGMGMPGTGMTGAGMPGMPNMPDVKQLIEEKRREAEAKIAQEVKDAEVVEEAE